MWWWSFDSLWRGLRMLLSCFSAPLLCLVTALCLWEDGASEISRRGCPFCPPNVCIPVEMAQWILPLGVFSWEPLHHSAGKLQRCLSPCCCSLSLQEQHAFLLSISCLGFRHSNDVFGTNLCWALRFEVEHTLANLVFPMFPGKGCVYDSVADSKCCEAHDSSTAVAVVGVAVCNPIAALFS